MLNDILMLLTSINMLLLTIELYRPRTRLCELKQSDQQPKPKNPCFYNQSFSVQGYQPPFKLLTREESDRLLDEFNKGGN